MIRFKVEGQIIKRHPEYGLNHRCLLEHVDFDKGNGGEVDGKTYPMLDGKKFPDDRSEDPLGLTEQEAERAADPENMSFATVVFFTSTLSSCIPTEACTSAGTITCCTMAAFH